MGIIAPFGAVNCLYADVDIASEPLANTGFAWFSPIIAYSSDFTFRDRNKKKFYWEHAGMMDQLVYQARHKRKMEAFEGIGIVPWKNLIVTYDVDGVINIPMIKSIIEHEVLPRL